MAANRNRDMRGKGAWIDLCSSGPPVDHKQERDGAQREINNAELVGKETVGEVISLSGVVCGLCGAGSDAKQNCAANKVGPTTGNVPSKPGPQRVRGA